LVLVGGSVRVLESDRRCRLVLSALRELQAMELTLMRAVVETLVPRTA
jgi:hypothetical protein